MSLSINPRGEKEILANLKGFPEAIEKASINADNTTATALRKATFKIAEKEYNTKSSRLKKDSRGKRTTFIKRSSRLKPGATITYKGGTKARDGDRPGIHHFRVDKSQKNKKVTGWTPSVQIRRGGSKEQLNDAFYGEGKLKGKGIFQRKEGSRDITRRSGPSVKQIMSDPIVVKRTTVIAVPLYIKMLTRTVHDQFNKLFR